VFDELADLGVFSGLPRVCAWRTALARRHKNTYLWTARNT
jgi:hypothetical protein